MRSSETSLGGPGRNFPDTVWDIVGRLNGPDRKQALEELCRGYWKPAYCYLRAGRGKSVEDAKDLAQGFFAWLVEGDALRRFAPERGKFRTFFKTLLKHFAQHHEEAIARLKRGGGAVFVGLDEAAVAGLPEDPDPDRAFEEAWRDEVVRRAVDRVCERLRASGQEVKIRAFEAYDCRAPEARPSYAELAGRLGVAVADVKSYLYQVRQAVQSQVRDELARLTSTREELEEEWNGFFQA